MEDDHITTEIYKLRDVYQFFLEACCRFFSNRFKQKISPETRALKDEIEYLRRENVKLVSTLISMSTQPLEKTDLGESDVELKPIRQFQPSWSEKKRQLEADARQRAAKQRELNTELTAEISNLESELGITQ
jgi:hypothetical protein